MRPTASESLKGIQASLFEVIAPELRSPFAQHTLQTMFMLLESIAAEVATMGARRDDAQRVDYLLARLEEAIGVGGSSQIELEAVVQKLPPESDAERQGLLEQAIVALETSAGRQSEGLETVRAEIYAYLREVASRGWSFWDMLSFRQAPS